LRQFSHFMQTSSCSLQLSSSCSCVETQSSACTI